MCRVLGFRVSRVYVYIYVYELQSKRLKGAHIGIKGGTRSLHCRPYVYPDYSYYCYYSIIHTFVSSLSIALINMITVIIITIIVGAF